MCTHQQRKFAHAYVCTRHDSMCPVRTSNSLPGVYNKINMPGYPSSAHSTNYCCPAWCMQIRWYILQTTSNTNYFIDASYSLVLTTSTLSISNTSLPSTHCCMCSHCGSAGTQPDRNRSRSQGGCCSCVHICEILLCIHQCLRDRE